MTFKDLIRKLKLIELLGDDISDNEVDDFFSELIDIRNNGFFYEMSSIDHRVEYNYYFYYKKDFLFSFYFLDGDIIIKESHRMEAKIYSLYILYNKDYSDEIFDFELEYELDVFCKYYIKKYLIKTRENIMHKI